MHTVFNNFGIEFRNTTSPDFVADYTRFDTVTISIDLKVDSIEFFGSPSSTPWVLDLRSSALAQGGYPWTSVWYEFDWVDANQYGEWTTLTVTIPDTSATDLPPGWGGYGDETPLAEPILPPGVTFTDVLGDKQFNVFAASISQYRTIAGSYVNLSRRFNYAIQGFSQTSFFYGQLGGVFYDPAFSGYIDRDLAVATRTIQGGSAFGEHESVTAGIEGSTRR